MEIFLIILIVIVSILALYLISSLILVFMINKKIFMKHQNDPDNPCYLRFEDYSSFMVREEYSCGFYGKRIKGYIYKDKTNDEYKGFIILSHGFWGTHVQYLVDIAYLIKAGYLVLAYDQYGVGLSEGSGPTSFSNGIYVLENVIHDVKKRKLNSGLPLYLYGHSWGAYCTMDALRNNDDIEKAVLRSGFDDPIKITMYLLKIQNKFLYAFLTPTYRMSYFLLFGRRNMRLAYSYSKKNKKTKLLVLQAKDDNMVPLSLSIAEKVKNKENVRLIVDDIGGHNTILRPEATENYNRLIAEYEDIKKKSVSEDEKKRKISDFESNLSRVDEYPYRTENVESIIEFLNQK